MDNELLSQVPPKFRPLMAAYVDRVASAMQNNERLDIVRLTDHALLAIAQSDVSDLDATDVVLTFINMIENAQRFNAYITQMKLFPFKRDDTPSKKDLN